MVHKAPGRCRKHLYKFDNNRVVGTKAAVPDVAESRARVLDRRESAVSIRREAQQR